MRHLRVRRKATLVCPLSAVKTRIDIYPGRSMKQVAPFRAEKRITLTKAFNCRLSVAGLPRRRHGVVGRRARVCRGCGSLMERKSCCEVTSFSRGNRCSYCVRITGSGSRTLMACIRMHNVAGGGDEGLGLRKLSPGTVCRLRKARRDCSKRVLVGNKCLFGSF